MCGLEVEHNDIGRQQIVEALLDHCRTLLDLRWNFNMHRLAERVHARIGSACALHLNVGPENLSRSFADFAHDRPGVFLFLPAAVPRSVVFEKDLEADHVL